MATRHHVREINEEKYRLARTLCYIIVIELKQFRNLLQEIEDTERNEIDTDTITWEN